MQEVDGGERRGAGQIMALIKSFEHKSMDRNSIHDGIDATYHDLRARRPKVHPGGQLWSGRTGNSRQEESNVSVG